MADLKIVLTVVDKDTGKVRTLRRSLADLAKEAENTDAKVGGLGGRLGGLMDGLGGLAKPMVAGYLGVQGIQAALGGVGSMLDAASDLNETTSKTGVVFGASSKTIEAFGDTAAEAIGQSKQQAEEAAASFGNMLNTVGLAERESAKMSKAIVTLASDMASFNNRDPSEMLEKLRSGLAGEAEPLRQFGVLLSEAAVKTKAYEMGLASAGAELTEGQKVLARYQLIMEQTTKAQGDFARTADQDANSQRILAARTADLEARFGSLLLPLRTGLIKGLIDLADAAEKLEPYLRGVGDLLGIIGEQGGKAAEGISKAGKAAADAVVPTGTYAEILKATNEQLERMYTNENLNATAQGKAASKAREARQAEADYWSEIAKHPDRSLISEEGTAAEVEGAEAARKAAKAKLEASVAASDEADSYNRVRTAAGLMAETQNKAEAAAAALAASKKADTEASKAEAAASREASDALRDLQAAYSDLARRPVTGSKAFSDKEFALQQQLTAIDYRRDEMVKNRGSRQELKALAKQRNEIDYELRQLQRGEQLVLEPQRRAIAEAANPTPPERDLASILADIPTAREGISAAEAAQAADNSGLATAIARETLQQITISAPVTITLPAGSDQAMAQRVRQAVDEAIRGIISAAGRAPAGATPGVAGGW